jgi:hypothetical protein
METFVYDYLTKNYYLDISDAGNDGIYLILDTRRFKAPTPSHKLLNDIMTIFALDIDTSKDIINLWAKSVNPDIDLEFYWKTTNDIFNSILPIIANLSASLSDNLVRVEPLSSPSGNLLYMDVVYDSGTPIQKIKNRVVNFFNKIFGIVKK